jgi:Peptidase M66
MLKPLLTILAGLLCYSFSGCQNTNSVINPGKLEIAKLEFAQTHVIPSEGKTFNLAGFGVNEQRTLRVVANRGALVLFQAGSSNLDQPKLEVLSGDVVTTTIPLNTPETLPKTEAGGPAYSSSLYWTKLPAEYIKAGLKVRFRTANAVSEARAVNIAAPVDFSLFVIPIYLFGATTDLLAFDTVKQPPQNISDEFFTKVPVAKLSIVNHPLGKLEILELVIAPRNNQAAYIATSPSDYKDGFAGMDATLALIKRIREANGDAPTANQYYGSLIQKGKTGAFVGTGGGLGGGHAGVGDHLFSGIFIHEQGHAFGMPHANDGFVAKQYPYIGGSLLGSSWGYDPNHNEFLAPFIPNSKTDGICGTYQVDDQKRCVKQDPMQSGAGTQAKGYQYAMFSDFNAAQVQWYFEGNRFTNDKGAQEYIGGRVEIDSSFASGYKHWDKIDQKYIEYTVPTGDKGLYGLNGGFPTEKARAVYTIMAALSNTTPTVNRIYAPVKYTGNLLQQIDPSSSNDLSDIRPNVGKYPWFCHAQGCDYTLRVTYSDGSILHRLLQLGFHKWWLSPDIDPTANDPMNGNSFRTWALNVPADKTLSKIELLYTPKGYEGLPQTPAVVSTWQP